MQTRTETILIIDDEAPMRAMLETFLKNQGFTVHTATNGKEGFEKHQALNPDVTLCDLKMPVMDGIEFLRALHAKNPDATVIMLTAFATLENAVSAMREGAYDYITKPVDDLVGELLKKVELGLNRANLVRENRVLSVNLQKVNEELRAKNEDMADQLAMAGVVQQSLLPADKGTLQGLRWACQRRLDEHVSGDFYDLQQIGPAQFGVLIGQVFGRDVPSALLMAMIIGTIRELQGRYKDPLSILNKANLSIKQYLEKGFQNFVTVFYGILDLEEKRFRFSSASHPPPVIVRFKSDGIKAHSLSARGNYLGKYKDAELALEEFPIRRNDLMLLYSESAVNITNAKGEVFGQKRLVACLEGHEFSVPEDILASVDKRMGQFDAKGLAGKDLALMTVRIL